MTATDVTNSVSQILEEEERLIGLIIPPPELRHVIETTAAFVAKNGKKFEEKIKASKPDQKFDFINIESPYHAFYIDRIKNLIKSTEEQPQPVTDTTQNDDVSEIKNLSINTDPTKKLQDDQETRPLSAPSIPIHELQFVVDPPTLKKDEINILKLTGIYTARFGRKFLIDIMEKEYKNPVFDFLKPQHSYFAYFIKLIEQYTNILVPEESTIQEIQNELADSTKIINEIHSRVSWKHFTEQKKTSADEALKKDRVAYSQIDWNDFTVVETINFKPNEEGTFLPPCLPNQAGTRTVVQERILSNNSQSNVSTDRSAENNDNSKYDNPMPSIKPPSAIPNNIKPENEQKLPQIEISTNVHLYQNIPQSTNDEIVNPMYTIVPPNFIGAQKNQESFSNYFPQIPVHTSMLQGTMDHDPNKVMPIPNMQLSVKPPIIPQNYQQSENLTMHQRNQSIPVDFIGQQPHKMPFQTHEIINNSFLPSNDSKLFKQETELMSEAQFLSQYGEDPLPFYISVPDIPNNSDWQLNGQTIEVTFTLHDKISLLKQQIADIIKFPASKQKIQFNGNFVKDSNTLAFYNVNPKSTIHLTLKERGGKKK